jgi:hypothetical protein
MTSYKYAQFSVGRLGQRSPKVQDRVIDEDNGVLLVHELDRKGVFFCLHSSRLNHDRAIEPNDGKNREVAMRGRMAAEKRGAYSGW